MDSRFWTGLERDVQPDLNVAAADVGAGAAADEVGLGEDDDVTGLGDEDGDAEEDAMALDEVVGDAEGVEDEADVVDVWVATEAVAVSVFAGRATHFPPSARFFCRRAIVPAAATGSERACWCLSSVSWTSAGTTGARFGSEGAPWTVTPRARWWANRELRTWSCRIGPPAAVTDTAAPRRTSRDEGRRCIGQKRAGG